MNMNELAIVIRAWFQLARFDLLRSARRDNSFGNLPPTRQDGGPADSQHLIELFGIATCFYWKRVMCLQRSVCLVRLLRAHGVAATLVVGYRPDPFIAHAWVEVDGRLVDGRSGYQTRLRRLYVA